MPAMVENTPQQFNFGWIKVTSLTGPVSDWLGHPNNRKPR